MTGTPWLLIAHAQSACGVRRSTLEVQESNRWMVFASPEGMNLSGRVENIPDSRNGFEQFPHVVAQFLSDSAQVNMQIMV